MKKLILLTLLFLSSFSFGQTKIEKEDTTTICFPVNIGKQILTDLTELDKLKKESELDKKEIKELENKITKEEGVIKFLEEKDKNNEVIIKDTEEKVKLLNTENGELRKDIKKMKVKNTVIEIVTGSLVTALTYILVFK
jgi:hypothetical protein